MSGAKIVLGEKFSLLSSSSVKNTKKRRAQKARLRAKQHVVCTRGTGTMERTVTSMAMATKGTRDKRGVRSRGGGERAARGNHLSLSTATAQGKQGLRSHASRVQSAATEKNDALIVTAGKAPVVRQKVSLESWCQPRKVIFDDFSTL